MHPQDMLFIRVKPLHLLTVQTPDHNVLLPSTLDPDCSCNSWDQQGAALFAYCALDVRCESQHELCRYVLHGFYVEPGQLGVLRVLGQAAVGCLVQEVHPLVTNVTFATFDHLEESRT